MCIIVHKPKNVTLERVYLENCFLHNEDGCGFAVAIDGELIIKKGYFAFDEFWESYKPFEKYPMLIHFRFATHGARNVENCHPFTVSDTLAFVHNGQIPEAHEAGSSMSDSWHFNEIMIRPYVEKFGNEIIFEKRSRYLIESFVDAGFKNKLAFMDNNGRTAIYGEKKGFKKFGCWFSKEDFLSPPVVFSWGEFLKYKNNRSQMPSDDFRMRGIHLEFDEGRFYSYEDFIPREKEGKTSRFKGISEDKILEEKQDSVLAQIDEFSISYFICDNCCDTLDDIRELVVGNRLKVCKKCFEKEKELLCGCDSLLASIANGEI
jgi:hypothetical protein